MRNAKDLDRSSCTRCPGQPDAVLAAFVPRTLEIHVAEGQHGQWSDKQQQHRADQRAQGAAPPGAPARPKSTIGCRGRTWFRCAHRIQCADVQAEGSARAESTDFSGSTAPTQVVTGPLLLNPTAGRYICWRAGDTVVGFGAGLAESNGSPSVDGSYRISRSSQYPTFDHCERRERNRCNVTRMPKGTERAFEVAILRASRAPDRR